MKITLSTSNWRFAIKSLLHTFFLLLVIITLNHTAYAQWSTNPNVNNPICTIADDQTDPSIISDDSSGAIIVWTDNRGGNSDIYAQRIDSSGIVQWAGDGVAISTATYDQIFPTLVGDSNGGAIIKWQDYRVAYPDSVDIYAQQVNANGILGVVSSIAQEPGSEMDFVLLQNYPNAFNPSTKIRFTISDLRF